MEPLLGLGHPRDEHYEPTFKPKSVQADEFQIPDYSWRLASYRQQSSGHAMQPRQSGVCLHGIKLGTQLKKT